jgi:S-adenosylmethionine hydrolase
VPPSPIITLTTDFGLDDHFVGTIKGVILSIAPEARLVDISHAIEPFDIVGGALSIAHAYSYFPSGTIHLVVVDPGVGSARRPILATTGPHRFVAPDNGVLSLVFEREVRLSVRHITAEHYYHQPVSQTFHGRDVFAPVAARLALGVDPGHFGEEIHDFMRLDLPHPVKNEVGTIVGEVLRVDHFGNLITNITPADASFLFQGGASGFRIVLAENEICRMRTAYAEGEPGEVFGILGSMGFLELVSNRDSAARILGAGRGSAVKVEGFAT